MICFHLHLCMPLAIMHHRLHVEYIVHCCMCCMDMRIRFIPWALLQQIQEVPMGLRPHALLRIMAGQECLTHWKILCLSFLIFNLNIFHAGEDHLWHL